MDDNPERRYFLDKLFSFMEEQGKPITACPTISKTPLDLFRLYVLTKERGGFAEVNKKVWSSLSVRGEVKLNMLLTISYS